MLELRDVPEDQLDLVAELLEIDLYEDESLFVALSGDEIKAWCIYALTDMQVVFSELCAEDDDEFVKDGLIRAVMTHALGRGIHYADFDDEIDPRLLDRLGFVEDGRHYNLFINKFFSGRDDLSS